MNVASRVSVPPVVAVGLWLMLAALVFSYTIKSYAATVS